MAPLSKISQDNPSADQMFPRSKNFAAFLTRLTTGPVVSLMRLTLRCAVLGPCELALFKHGERSIPFKACLRYFRSVLQTLLAQVLI
jgi:hypothetical protein